MSPPTKRTTCIEDLPPEMICELFEHLHPKDLAACSMVNRRWHSIHAAFKVHTLAVVDYPSVYDLKWYHSNQPIREVDQCRQAMFLHLAEKPLLTHLKHLALFDSSKIDLNQLNRFQQLVHLEIHLGFLTEKVHLTLPKLKVLTVRRFDGLSIDCPLLSTLVYDGKDTDVFEVKHPETIRKLVTDMVDPKWLALFKNVECLITTKYGAISKTTLLSLPRLRELHLDQDIEMVFDEESDHGPGTVDRLKRTLSEFLRGSDFRFAFCGFQLTKTTKTMLDQIDFVQVDEERPYERTSNEYVYMKNYHLIEPGALHFVHRVAYPNLVNNVTGEFPRCFFEKFTDINQVTAATGVLDADHFLWFLKSLRSLRELNVWLTKANLGQEFFDQLPASAHSLKTLELIDQSNENELELNFDFIGKLPLSELRLSSFLGVSSESLSSLVRSIVLLGAGEFHFQFRGTDFLIWKFSTKCSLMDASHELLFESENSDEIVNFIQGHQE